jgi:hypothetical protein
MAATSGRLARGTRRQQVSEQIEPGDGWRLLGPDEVVKDGDEPWHRFEKRWMYGPMDVPYTAKAYPAVRRRIPAKPEAMEIDDELTITADEVKSQPCLIHREENKPYWICFEPEECRKLADWLNRYANWREYQNTKTDAGQSRHET